MRVMRAPADGGSAAIAGTDCRWQTARLMSPQLELATDELHALLSDGADFTVVGVLGSQGVGKSTIMSLLAGAGWHAEPASAAPAGGSYTSAYAVGGEAGTAECSYQCGLADPPFPPASLDARLRAEHGTVGIDVAVTPERLILLDTQPLLSASVLLAMQGSALPPNAQSHENLHEVQALQLAMLVLSVCHVVVLVQDGTTDVRWWRTLRTAQMLRHGIPDVSTAAVATPAAAGGGSTAGGGCGVGGGGASARGAPFGPSSGGPGGAAPDGASGYQPTLAFVLTRLAMGRLGDVARRSAVCETVGRLFATEALGLAGSVAPPLVFALPCSSEPGPTSLHGGFTHEAEMLRDQILSLRRRPFARPGVTERDWLRGVAKVWEMIRQSANVEAYNQATHKLHMWT